MPLHLPAAEVLQPRELLSGLDAFGEHLEAQLLPERDYRPDDGGVLRLRGHAVDEGFIHFEAIHRQPREVAQARGARAETFHGKTPAGLSGQRALTSSTWARTRENCLHIWLVDTLTHRVVGTPARAPQAAAVSQASRRTHAPSSVIKPVCSASGMNNPGATVSPPGLNHRARASTPQARPVLISYCGW